MEARTMGQELSLSVASLRAAYPNATLPAETVEIYRVALSPYDPASVQQAVVHLVRRTPFFPSISEIIAAVAELELRLLPATAAWSQAEARAVGAWHGEKDPLVTDALNAIGGIWAIRTSENPVATRAHFLKFYEQLRSDRIAAFIDGEPDAAPEPAAVASVPMPALRDIA